LGDLTLMFWTQRQVTGRLDVTQRQGPFSEQADFRPICVGVWRHGELEKNRAILVAQFAGAAFADHFRRKAEPLLERAPQICCEQPLANWTRAEAALHE
jgi:hypothetical protein